MEIVKLKLVMLGESSTGKTTIVNRLVRGSFELTDSTIGASFVTINNDGIKYEIWDTAGSERFLSLTPMYYRNADIVILVFDVNNCETIDRILFYLDKIYSKLINPFRVIIIGNKKDLVSKQNLDEIDATIKKRVSQIYINENTKIHVSEYIYMSAKDGNGCESFYRALFENGAIMRQVKSVMTDDMIITINPDKKNDYPCCH